VQPDGSLLVLDADLSVVGETAARYQIPLHELSEQAASLEQAFLEATSEATQYHALSGPPPRWTESRTATPGGTPPSNRRRGRR